VVHRVPFTVHRVPKKGSYIFDLTHNGFAKVRIFFETAKKGDFLF
jgi:hypothetical protein